MRVETKTWTTKERHVSGESAAYDYTYTAHHEAHYVHPETETEKVKLFNVVLQAKSEIKDFRAGFNQKVIQLFKQRKSELYDQYTKDVLSFNKKSWLHKVFTTKPLNLSTDNIVGISKDIIVSIDLLKQIQKMPDDIRLFYTPLKKELYECIVNYKSVIEQLNSCLTLSNIVNEASFYHEGRLALVPPGGSPHIWYCEDFPFDHLVEML